MPVDWQPIECAPKDGSTIEAMSRDWGKRKSTTLYRARWFAGHWRNAEDPLEQPATRRRRTRRSSTSPKP
jgi:hypothetical protein